MKELSFCYNKDHKFVKAFNKAAERGAVVLPQRVLQLIRDAGPISRAELARQTGASKPTISSVVQNLLAAGLINELGLAESDGGRRAVLVEFNARAGFVIGMDIGGTSARVALADLQGKILLVCRERTDQSSEAALITQLKRLQQKLCHEAKIAQKKLLHIGIGTPGVVDPKTRAIGYAPNLPVLEAPGFTKRLEDELGVPLSFYNDVNLAALGEKAQGAGQVTDTFIFIGIGTGLGFGLILGGALFEGSKGRAGEFGYLPVSVNQRATLEDTICGAALARSHKEAGGSGDPQIAFAEAEAGVEPGISTIRVLTERLVWLFAALSTLLDPDKLILGGSIGRRCAPLLPELRVALGRSSPIVPELAISQLGDDAGLLGAVAIALQKSEPLTEQLGGKEMAL